jgi:hypothetical protein
LRIQIDLKMAVFWAITHRPDDGGSKDLWNDGRLLPDCTALQHRRQPSSYSPPWEPQIVLRLICSHLQTTILRMSVGSVWTDKWYILSGWRPSSGQWTIIAGPM